MINYDIKFLTCDEALQVKNNDFKSFKYEKKKVDETVYDSGKRSYCERRGGLWRAAHPRQVRQLESKLRDKNIITCEWTSDSLITIVFSSGVITYLTVKPSTLDVTQILFDRFFVGKLAGQAVSNVALCKSHILLTYSDRTATLVTFGKSNTNLPCRISDRDPHIQNVELGGSSRRTERHLSTSEDSTGARVLVWSVTVAEPAPWSPVIEDHANLHLYSVNGHQISLTAYHQLENETLLAELSSEGDNVIHIVEQITSHKSGVKLEWARYCAAGGGAEAGPRALGAARGRTRVALGAPARACVRRHARALVAAIDGALHVLHQEAGLTHTARPGFMPTEMQWAGELVVAAEEGGRLQCFDRALNALHHHSKCLDLTEHLRDSRRMQMLTTRSANNGPMILLLFSSGPLALLHITHPQLITSWLRTRRPQHAVALLRAMDWEREGARCLWALDRLLAAATDATCEAVCEAALGTYLAPLAPLRSAAKYAPPVHDLARKFFHHLLRRGRTDKALRLAVDLRDADLFCDVRAAAGRSGDERLAREARALAAEHAARAGSECSGSCSGCSSHSYSESEDELSETSDIVKTKPPPLPRVSMPNLPTVMQVPIATPAPTSTNSIRPNLHQYLERDNTIWTTDVKDTINYQRDYPKPVRSGPSVRWHSMDVLANYKPSVHGLMTINESPVKATRTVVDIIPRLHDDRLNSNHFKHLYQTELREEVLDRSNTLYRYQNNNNYQPSTSLKDRTYRMDETEKQTNRSGEKNKVKFSDTVTIAVVSEAERPSAGAGRAARAQLAENAPPKPPKIKVVHFGMV